MSFKSIFFFSLLFLILFSCGVKKAPIAPIDKSVDNWINQYIIEEKIENSNKSKESKKLKKGKEILK